ncbi:MAG: hypothetical protein QNJ32_17125 [Xenococcaceae cyanobacterium MO_167.B27]|nr:hypothetical protein [Xenococcaceae cyanobacterium MO_167.B27]
MNATLELTSGKIINMNRFVALLPDAQTNDNPQYLLLLEGYDQPINIDYKEAILIKETLKSRVKPVGNNGLILEKKIKQKQSKLKLLRKRIQKLKQGNSSPEKEAFLQETQTPVEQKLS